MSDETVLHLTYVCADSGRALLERQLRRAELPPGLRFAPTVRLGALDWAVVRAEPGDPGAALRGRRLRLTVRQVSDLTDRSLLFRQPTLAAELPPLDRQTRRAGAILELPEDAWRQVELVALEELAAVERCLASVRRAIERRVPGGYPLLHVRREVPRPLPPSSLPLPEVRERFTGAFSYDGLSYRGVQALVASGFAFQVASAIQVYGRVADGGVACLGLYGWGSGQALGPDVAALTGLATDRRLALVDWCRGTLLTPGAFAGYFRARSASS